MNDNTPVLSEKTPVPPVCPRCGITFTCGMQAGEPVCWCAALPPLKSVPSEGMGCFCQACLRAILDDDARS